MKDYLPLNLNKHFNAGREVLTEDQPFPAAGSSFMVCHSGWQKPATKNVSGQPEKGYP